jgi:hypothetical protein
MGILYYLIYRLLDIYLLFLIFFGIPIDGRWIHDMISMYAGVDTYIKRYINKVIPPRNTANNINAVNIILYRVGSKTSCFPKPNKSLKIILII